MSANNDPETGELGDLVFGPGGLNSKVGMGEIISSINQSPEEVKIQAQRLTLEGLITANQNFKITEQGSVVISGDSTLSIGGSGGANSNFYVDSNGNVTMRGSINLAGNITWPSTGVPVDRNSIYNAMLKYADQDGLYSYGGYLCVNATAIKTGTLDADTVNVKGTLSTLNVKLAGSYGGFAQGRGAWRQTPTSADVTTYGVVMYGSNGLDSQGNANPPYFMVTNMGMRGQVSSEYYWYMSGDNFVVNGDFVLRDHQQFMWNNHGIYMAGTDGTYYRSMFMDTNNSLLLGSTSRNTAVYGYSRLLLNSLGNVDLEGVNITAKGSVSGFVTETRLLWNPDGNTSGSVASGYKFYIFIGTPSSTGTWMSLVVPGDIVNATNGQWTFQIADESNFSRFSIGQNSYSRSAGSGSIKAIYGIGT